MRFGKEKSQGVKCSLEAPRVVYMNMGRTLNHRAYLKLLEHKNVPLETKCIFLVTVYSLVSQTSQNINSQFSDVFHLV